MASVQTAITQSNHTEGEATKARVGVINALSHVKLPPRNIHSRKGKEAKELEKDPHHSHHKGRATVVMNCRDYVQSYDVVNARTPGHLPAHGKGPNHLLREQDEQ